MKRILLVSLVVMTAASAMAQQRKNRPRPSAPPYEESSFSTPSSSYSYSSSQYSNSKGSNYVFGNLGFFSTEQGALYKDQNTNGTTPALSGIFDFGADFEHMMENDFGLVGMFRYFSTSDKQGANTTTSISGFVFGAGSRFHFPNRMLDFYFTPGLSFASATAKLEGGGQTQTTESGTVIHAFAQFGAMYALNNQMAVGAETTRYLSLSSELNGILLTELVFKFRYSLK